MRVLVTGASGFIGRTLVKRLLDDGHKPILLIEGPTSGKPILPPYLEQFNHRLVAYSGDLRDRETIANLVQQSKPETVVHLAAAGVTDPFLDYQSAIDHNILGTVNLVQAAFGGGEERHRAKKMIVARTPGEASNINVYAASKAAAWAFCSMYTQTSNWPITGATIFQAFGPGQAEHTLIPSAMKAALSGENFPMTSGAQLRDWIFVDDVARGLSAMMGSALPPGACIDLGTGKATSVLEAVEIVYRLANKGGNPLPGEKPDRPGETQRQIADIKRTKDFLGWQPAISIETGLARMMASPSNPQ